MCARFSTVPLRRAAEGRVPDALRLAPGLSDAAVRLYAGLAQPAVAGLVVASQEALAARLGWSRRTVGRALAELVAAGLVEYARGSRWYVLRGGAQEGA